MKFSSFFSPKNWQSQPQKLTVHMKEAKYSWPASTAIIYNNINNPVYAIQFHPV
jgi:hypothetical protein